MSDSLSKRVLEKLDRWRHYPKFQLERHVDIFLAFWLPQVLEAHSGQPIDRRLIPEFPIKKSLFANAKGRETVNMDFLALSEDKATAWLVELKTEMSSRRDSQDKALEAAVDLDWEEVLGGLLSVIQRYGKRERDRKYRYLSRRLEELGLLNVPRGLNDVVFAEGSRNEVRCH